MKRAITARLPNLLTGLLRDNDMVLLAVLAFLAPAGFLLVMSASTQFSEIRFSQPFHYAFRHFVLLLFGLIGLLIARITPLRFWMKMSPWMLIISLLLLLLVFVPGIGREVNASSRWLDFRFFTLQPAELLKFTIPVFCAFYLAHSRQSLNESRHGLVIPIGVTVVVCILLLLQPDFGSAFILAMTVFIVLFLAGMRWRDCIGFGTSFVLMNVLLVLIQPYRLKRLMCMKDGNIWEHFFDHCYQIGHSLIAIERGGLTGVGLGGSIQKYLYLPEAHTDFSFSIIAEELGFAACLLLVAIFLFFALRIMNIGYRALQADYFFAAYLLYAIAVLWFLQILINIGVALGYLPVTGLPLPFLSYGGTNLVINFFLVGIVLRAYMELLGYERNTVRTTA